MLLVVVTCEVFYYQCLTYVVEICMFISWTRICIYVWHFVLGKKWPNNLSKLQITNWWQQPKNKKPTNLQATNRVKSHSLYLLMC